MSGLFVRCDGDEECTNGAWLHPQCTTDLRVKSKEELDAIEEWYCEDCVARIKKEDEPRDEEEDGDISEIQIDDEGDDIEVDIAEGDIMDIDQLN